MPFFRITKKAIDDLRSMGRYTEKNWGRKQRNRYLALLDDSIKRIGRNPEIGVSCSEIRAGYRKYHVGRHLVFYRQEQESVEVIRILHDSMDVTRHF